MTTVVYDFEWPDGFLDTIRVEGRDKILFDGFVHVTDGEEIPAYEFGVQTVYVCKVSSNVQEYIAVATVNNPGQMGNSVTIHIWYVRPDGTLVKASEEFPGAYAVPVKINFNGEGS